MDSITVWDQYGQPWRIDPDNPLYEEAQSEAATVSPEKVIWPISKITEDRGWGWWSVFHKLEDFEAELEQLIPNPHKQRLIDLDTEYTPEDLENMLQKFGSYLASLHHTEGMLEAQCHALKQGLKTGMDIAIAQNSTINKIPTVSGRETAMLSGQEVFRDTRKMQIEFESTLLLVKGWRNAYEQAWTTTSRIISLRIGEAGLQTSRYA